MRAEKGRFMTPGQRRGQNDPGFLFKDPMGAVSKGAGVQPLVLSPVRLMCLASDLPTLVSRAFSGFQMWTW